MLMLLRALVRLALIALLIYLLYRFYLALRHAFRHSEPHPPDPHARPSTMVLDPECGNYVHEYDALRADVDGRPLHFCSRECRDAYLRKHPR